MSDKCSFRSPTQLKRRWIRNDPWTVRCPYCGIITQYPDDICDSCNNEVLPCKTQSAEG